MKVPWHRVALIAGIAAALWSSTAFPRAGVQITPDGKQTLISKDVGSERWAITLNGADGSITGNVFQADGGEPRFVACEETFRLGSAVTFRCLGADRCALGPCPPEEWVLIAEVSLAEEFLLPPLEFGSILELEPPLSTVLQADGSRPSGVQAVPGGTRTLISKDVGEERWAITFNEDDGSVTGNVFFPAGGDPAFVWCEEASGATEQIRFSCYGADRCVLAPCPREDWTFIAEVVLPASFLAPPAAITVDSLAAALVGSLGQDGAFVAVVVALDKGYSLRQISRAAMSGRLGASGDIETRSGGLETPENPPSGLFAAGELATIQAELPPPADLSRDFGDAVGQDQKTALLVRLLDQGFSLSQVGQVARGEVDVVDCNQATSVEAFRECVRKYGSAIAVVRPDGSAVSPDRSSEDVLTRKGRDPCGNGRIDGGEQCDGAALGGETCITRGYAGGDLRCNEVCELDTSRCRQEAKCGDGIADQGELCDGADLRGLECPDVDDRFVAGRLLCRGCIFDTSQCLSQALCGNGRIDKGGGTVPLEDCDGPDLGGKRCSDFSPNVAGLLHCDRSCHFDLRDCRDAGETDCGNGIAEGNEHCDRRDLRGLDCTQAGDLFRRGPFVGGALGCDTECRYVFDACTRNEKCGNGVGEGNEQCDGTDLRGQTCQTAGQSHPDGPFSGGSLACDEYCHFDVDRCVRAYQCGDGVRDTPFEECDRLDFGGRTCEQLFGRGGNLICTVNCEIDPRSCQREQRCGDDFAEGTEQCDGFDLRNATCETRGFAGGTLRCGPDCVYDTAGCFEIRCGDDVADGSEQCDGRDLRGATCESLGFRGGGNLVCGSDCRFDTRSCTMGPQCGNGVAEGTEECDGSDVRHQSCSDFGFEGGGTLGCYTNCQIDTRACLEEPPCTEQLCPDGTCVPIGADCCGGGLWCDPGRVCTDDGGCCPTATPIGCAGLYCMPAGADCCGSAGWCNPGFVCAGNGCCPEDTPKACGDGTCTTFDRICCGNGTSCPAGTQCLPGGGCA